MKKKIKQLFCKHDKNWYTKNNENKFASLRGETRYLICSKCEKEFGSFVAEYEGNGFK